MPPIYRMVRRGSTGLGGREVQGGMFHFVMLMPVESSPAFLAVWRKALLILR